MKKLVLIAIALVTFQMNAQNEKAEKFNNSSVEEIAEMQTARLTKALTLNEAQQKRISILSLQNANLEKEMMAARNNKSLSKGERKKIQNKRHALKNERDNHMKSILTAEQYTKWSSIKEEQNKREDKLNKRRAQ
ncbi:hypothetical protein ES677_13980 [Bizionia gelidisalsuginis]|uniref:DUF4890 domain-containing protein n=2 Tax=Bizionia TaxID=283785 RepID=A0A8H2LFQ5_9FLAO|nr:MULTISPECIES: hypothetical protein [Bizionia]TYB72504.1 hypothetical protein ES676_11075 [Bizionia saleffrena]TYC08781.1 hypothetical protein ES677_13980 [Bizionia gelidisalsuginis]